MKFFFIIWYVFQFWIAIYLAVPFLLLLVYAVKKLAGSNFDISRKKEVFQKDFDFGVIITVHGETALVPALIDSLRKQQYQNFMVYVVADNCEDELPDFDLPFVTVLSPIHPLNSKIRSIQYAVEHFKKTHDAIVIFDSDNLVHPQFFHYLNQYFRKGYKVVQANMLPKNQDSVYARLDSIGNVFYNFTEREARMELGLSSAIWGLGLCVDTNLYKEIVYNNHLGGFDKKIQATLVQHNQRLVFAREAIVYDEKVENGSDFEKQRTRWIHAYFRYFGLNWQLFWQGLRTGNSNTTLFGFMNLRPPFFLLILLVLASSAINYVIHIHLFFAWMVMLILFAGSFVIIVQMRSRGGGTFKSILLLPLLIVRQCFALIKIRRAGKTFLKTKHNKLVYIEDLIGK